MRDLMAELKELRLHGMATAWAELTAQGESNTASSKWLLEHLLEQEHTDRAMRSVSHQMNMAKLPMHRDLESSPAESRWFFRRLRLQRLQRRRSFDQRTGQSGLYRHRAERGADRWAWHR